MGSLSAKWVTFTEAINETIIKEQPHLFGPVDSNEIRDEWCMFLSLIVNILVFVG